MSEKPEALRLAEELEAFARFSGGGGMDVKAATELRRQHAEIERLRDLLLDIRKDAATSHWHRDIDAALRGVGV